MNHFYRVIYNRVLGCWQAVSELAKSTGKLGGTIKRHAAKLAALSTVAAISGLGSGVAQAQNAPAVNQLPQGGNVAAGSAQINQSGNVMNIDQATQKAIINWNEFNVGQDARVNFNQPGADSATLNRVLSNDPSQIFGQIVAPGQVILINPNGAYFAPSASVDVGGLIATTHELADKDFLAGNYQFKRNGAKGKIINEGELKAKLDGYIALMAPEVRNQGVIVAERGTVVLAAGEHIQLNFGTGNKLQGITVTEQDFDAQIENKHAIFAEGGLVILSARATAELRASVIKNSGQIVASAGANTVTMKGGRIIFEGDTIAVQEGSQLIATGPKGGGEILVGGDWQGGANEARRVLKTPDAMRQATTVTVEKNTTLNASATDNGNGGTVVVWSDVKNSKSVTTVQGQILAKGGENGGDGGQIETSGAKLITDGVSGSAAAQNVAAGGKAGEWLFDPTDIVIGDKGRNLKGDSSHSNISAASIGSLLTSGTNVRISTASNGNQAGNILVESAIRKTDGKAVTLTLDAHNKIDVTANITTTTGDLNLVFKTGAGTGVVSGELSLLGGSIIKEGLGALMLTGANTYSGMTTISLGTLYAVDAEGLPVDSHLLFDGGVFQSQGLFTRSNTPTPGVGTFSNASSKNTLFSAFGGKLTIAIGGDALPEQMIHASNGSFANGFRSLNFAGINANAEVEVLNNISLNNGARAIDVTVGDNTGNFFATLSGVIRDGSGSGAGTIQKQGPGRLNLTGNNTYSGETRFNNGDPRSVLGLGHQNAFGTSTLFLSSTGYVEPLVDLGGDNKISNNVSLTNTLFIVGSHDLNIGGVVTVSGGNKTIQNNLTGASLLMLSGTVKLQEDAASIGRMLFISGNGDTTISGTIVNGGVSGAGSLAKLGTGTLTLLGVNTYTGSTTVSAGTLKLSANNVLADATAVIVSGGNFNLGGFADTVSGVQLISGSITNGTLTSTSNFDVRAGSVSAVLAGSVGLNKSTAGSVTLSGANTFTGDTQINAGILKLGAAATESEGVITGPIGRGKVVVSNGAALDLAGFDLLQPLNLAGTGVSGSGALFNSTANSMLVLGAITITADASIKSTSGGLSFGAIDGSHALVVDSTSGVTFAGVVGATTALTSLEVLGVSAINGKSITTTGNQSFAKAVTLGANTTLNTSNGEVDFSGALNSATSQSYDLTFISGTGAVTLSTVGMATGGVLGALFINSAGTTTFGGAIKAASLLTGVGGTLLANGGDVTTTGNQTYNKVVTLGNDLTAVSTAGTVTFNDNVGLGPGPAGLSVGGSGAVTFVKAVDVSSLSVSSSASSVTFVGAVGTAVVPSVVAVSGDTHVTFVSSLDAVSVSVAATKEFVSFIGAVGAKRAPDSMAITAKTSVTFISTLDVANMALDVSQGGATFVGAVGASVAPATMALSVTDDVFFIDTLDTSLMAVSSSKGVLTFVGAVGSRVAPSVASLTSYQSVTFLSTLDARTIVVSSTNGSLNFIGPVGGQSAVESLSAVAHVNSIFSATVDAQTINVSSIGDTQFTGLVGTRTPVSSISVSATNIRLSDVSSTGTQSYGASGTITTNSTYTSQGGAINFGGDLIINDAFVVNTTANGATGADVTFAGTVNSKSNASHLF